MKTCASLAVTASCVMLAPVTSLLRRGLLTAATVAINAGKTGGGRGGAGGGAGRTRVVCLTDGGANVGLDRSQEARTCILCIQST